MFVNWVCSASMPYMGKKDRLSNTCNAYMYYHKDGYFCMLDCLMNTIDICINIYLFCLCLYI